MTWRDRLDRALDGLVGGVLAGAGMAIGVLLVIVVILGIGGAVEIVGGF